MFSIRLTQLREDLGLTRKDVAEKLNIDQTTYGKYELSKRQPDYDTLQKLATFFNTSVDYLLGRTNDRNPVTSNDDWPDDIQVMMRDASKLSDEQKEIVKRLIKEFINEK